MLASLLKKNIAGHLRTTNFNSASTSIWYIDWLLQEILVNLIFYNAMPPTTEIR